MKRVILIVCFIFGATQFANAQVDFGLKGGVNYNSESITNVKDAEREFLNGAKGKLGYHGGIWLRAKIPAIGLYIRPELVYTALKSEATSSSTKVDYNFQKIDVPVLLGKKFANVLYVHAGPSFQYIIDGDFKFNQATLDKAIKSTDASGFTVGLQLGAGVEFGNFGIDVRWERAFSDVESKLIPTEVGSTQINFDTRVNQIIFGISYKL